MPGLRAMANSLVRMVSPKKGSAKTRVLIMTDFDARTSISRAAVDGSRSPPFDSVRLALATLSSYRRAWDARPRNCGAFVDERRGVVATEAD
jgi:hypothetical protein